MDQVFSLQKNNRLINQLYVDYETRCSSEQALLSDLSNEMHADAIRYFNLNEIEKAQASIFGLASWISKDVYFFLKKKDTKQRLYEYDMVSSLQFMGQLINICEDFKQWEFAYALQREYSKLNIRYSLMKEAA
jgi:hypothetical protein